MLTFDPTDALVPELAPSGKGRATGRGRTAVAASQIVLV